jgi:hypothetical protein
MALQTLYHRDDERSRLAGTRPGHAHDVAPLEK